MALLPAVCAGPVSFTDPASGTQVFIPVSSLSFDNGALKGSGAIYTKYQAAADAILGHLARIGYIVPGAPPARKPALEIRAKLPGAAGNSIYAEFFDFDYSDASNPKFKARVTQSLRYAGLTSATVQTVLGDAAGSGLIFVPGPAPVAGAVPKVGTYAFAITGPATSAAADIPAEPSGTAFQVQAREAGAEGANTKVLISAVDAVRATFALESRWEKTTSARIAAADLAAAFSYVIEVVPPAGLAQISAPGPGALTLSGGAESQESRKASAIGAG